MAMLVFSAGGGYAADEAIEHTGQNLRMEFADGATRVAPLAHGPERAGLMLSGDTRSGSAGWSFGMAFAGMGCREDVTEEAPAGVFTGRNRFEYRWGAVVEWYVRDARGIEHGFDVPERPCVDRGKGEPLRFLLELRTDLVPELDMVAEGMVLRDGTGRARLRYDKLLVLDASGEAVDSWFELEAAREDRDAVLSIVVDDAGAAYPLTVDPLLTNEVAKVAPATLGADDEFGASIDIDGDIMVVGAPDDDEQGANAGAIYIFERDYDPLNPQVPLADSWGLRKRVIVDGGAAGDQFGRSVAVSGEIIVVGADSSEAATARPGAAYVYERNYDPSDPQVPSADNWGLRTVLAPLDGVAPDFFGASVDVYGNTIVVLAEFGPGATMLDVGAAYVFERDYDPATPMIPVPHNWGEADKILPDATNDFFPWLSADVAIYQDNIVVGAPLDTDSGIANGIAYVFERAGDGIAWDEAQILSASDALMQSGVSFGNSVDIDLGVIIVGAQSNLVGPNNEDEFGAAYVFEFDVGGSGTWQEVAKLEPDDSKPPFATSFFGRSVSISMDTVAVGAVDNDLATSGGAVYLFRQDEDGTDQWGQSGKLRASDVAASDEFGSALGISGTTIVAGAPGVDDVMADAGAAYVFETVGTTGGIGNVFVFEDDPDTVLDLSTAFSDLGVLTPTYTVRLNTDTDLLTATVDNVADTLTLDFLQDANGVANVTAVASDMGLTVAAEATWLVTVEAVNDAPVAQDDVFTRTEDVVETSLGVTGSSGGGADSDVDGDDLSITAVTAPDQGGTATIDNTGEAPVLVYTPVMNFFGAETFVYTISDTEGVTATATVTVNVTGVNDAPVASDDSGASFETDEDTLLVTESVLLNDMDVDSTPFVASFDDTGLQGSLTSNGDGTFDYDPRGVFDSLAVGEQEDEVFSYVLSDGELTDTATVGITVFGVNDAPAARNDVFTLAEDSGTASLAVLGDNGFGSDGDVDNGDSVSLSAVGPADNGGLAVQNGNSVDYTSGLDFFGVETFVYTITDTEGATATATATVNVTGVNDGPVASDDSGLGFETDEDTLLVTESVLLNDMDVDSTPFVASFDDTGLQGSLTSNGDGTFDYDPRGVFDSLAVGEQEDEVFSYVLSDGELTDTATVGITVFGVNDAPAARNDVFTLAEDSGTASLAVLGDNGFGSDGDVDNGDSVSLFAVGPTDNGGSAVQNGNSIDYTPGADVFGVETFVYTITDTEGATATATVTVNLTGVNDRPEGTDDSGTGFETDEDNAFTTVSVLANDMDADLGDALSVASFDTTGTTGMVQDNGGGTFTYDPDGLFESLAASQQAEDSFSYVLTDTVLTDTATVVITIFGVNDAPVAKADTFTVDENSGNTLLDVLGGGDAAPDSDIDDGDVLTVSAVGAGSAGGSLGINANAVEYAPALDFSGVETFDYTISDMAGATATATVTVNVLETGFSITAFRAQFFPDDVGDELKEATVWGDLADPDDDGLPNIVEYFMGLDPTVSDAADIVQVEEDGTQLSILFRRAPDRPDAVGVAEWSTNLVDWFTAGVTESVEGTVMGSDVEVVRASVVIGADGEKFLRVTIQSPDP